VLRVTADTNICISAFKLRRQSSQADRHGRGRKFDLVISDAIIEETRRILGKRFGWPPEDVEGAEAETRDSRGTLARA